MTVLEDLVLRYRNKPWNWGLLSMNPAISLAFISEHNDWPWVNVNVSRNPSITEMDILSRLYPLDYSGLFSNTNLGFKFFKDNFIDCKYAMRIDWSSLSANPAITTFDVLHHPYYPWDDKFLSSNPNISSAFILNEGSKRFWFAPSVSANPGITKRDIVKSTLRSLFEWDYTNLSINPNLPLAYVNDNMDKPWNWFEISKVASMTDIERYYNFNWDSVGLSMNKGISMDYIFDRSNIAWDKQRVMINSAISIDDVMDNLDWFCIHIHDVKKILCTNPNITQDWIDSNVEYVDWDRLSGNAPI